MEPAARRYDMLMAWRSSLVATGAEPLPAADDLRTIAIAGSPQAWPQHVDAATTEPWRPTIEWLLSQLKSGAADPVGHIPAELRRPAGREMGTAARSGTAGEGQSRAGSVSGSANTDSPALTALKSWHQEGLRRGAVGFSALKDVHLRRIVSSPDRSPATIAKMLPHQALRSLGGEVAELLRAADAGASGDGASRERTAPEPSGYAASGGSPLPGPAGSRDAEPAPAAPSSTRSPAPSPPVEAAAGSPAHAVDPEEFEPYDLSVPAGEPAALRASTSPSGHQSLRWTDRDRDTFTVYRIVSGDEYAPYSPDNADLVAVTHDTKAVDARPLTSAVRHYQVWRNAGPDADTAVQSQPTLHAAGSVVSPVQDLDVRSDGGRVIGQWRALVGTERVQVYRVPIERAAQAGLSPEYQILADRDNLGGFVDPGGTRGATYLYRICAAARVDGGLRLSSPSSVEITLDAVLAPVTDLSVDAKGEGGARVFDLHWTSPPAGRVLVYRSPKPPRAGAGSEARAMSALPQMQLVETDRLSDPIEVDGAGRSLMRDVPWPEGWTRAYFTPVTVLDDTVRVGTTTSATWVPPAGMPRVVERVDRQVLTFAWPEGAAAVLAYAAPLGTSPDTARGGRHAEVSKKQYEDLGGLTFPFLLPAEGCAVHIVPVAFAAGEKVEGTPVTIEYRGLLRLSYTTSLKRGLTGRPSSMMVAITSAIPVAPPPFVLVHNSDRLPLDVGDGTPLDAVRDGDETMAVTRRPLPERLAPKDESRWKFDVRNRQGYVRLFVDLPPQHLQRVALLDPPVSQLRLDALFGGRA